MISIGIDKIGFATSHYMLEMKELAVARNEDPAKFKEGLLLDALSISPITEDIVTLASSAASEILTEDDKKAIDMIILATESSIDQSKAASVYVHSLLNIQPFVRSIEMKEACYSATAALDYARLHIENQPNSKVLVLASDIAKYGINSSGEPTQGAGSIALLISKDPHVLVLHNKNVSYTRDVMDFWRPNYRNIPFVDGMYSTKQYLDTLKITWQEYQKRFNTDLSEYAAFCFHLPFPKLALKGLNKLFNKETSNEVKKRLTENFFHSATYSKVVGNIYTGSLYLGLLSLLENSPTLKAKDKIIFFSYGSGAVTEIFSGHLVEGYKNYLQTNRMTQLQARTTLSVKEYEEMFFEEPKFDNEGNASFKTYKTGPFALSSIQNHQRQYVKVEENDKN